MNKSGRLGITLVSVLGIAGCIASKNVESRGQCMNSTASTCKATGAATVDVTETVRNVPVIDVSALMDPSSFASPQWLKAAEEVSSACEEWGFFQAVNHGMSSELLRGLEEKGREMFALPREEKSRMKRTVSNARGWYDDEFTKQTLDWKEGFDIGHVPRPDLPPDHPSNVVREGYNQWPADLPGFKETLDTFYSEATRVSQGLLEGIAFDLKLPRDSFGPAFKHHTSYLRLNYYPPCPEPCEYLSVNRHSDAGALTVLLQGMGSTALQVNYKPSGNWVSIPPVEGALTINVGDMLQVWTNGLFQAPEHRVLSQASRDRLSAPFFYNPGYEADIAPLSPEPATSDGEIGDSSAAGRLARQGPPRYKAINWGEFRMKRFAGDYADQGEEDVQIAHFLLSSA